MTALQTLNEYYATIRDAINANDLPLVVKTATTGLQKYPRETDLVKVQAIALIKQEKVQEALVAIDKSNRSNALPKNAMRHESAYCQFILGNYTAAQNVLKGAEQNSKTQYLLAQIAYKAGNFAECVSIYDTLLSEVDKESQEYRDILLNMSAARAADALYSNGAQDREDVATTQKESSENNYELIFNQAISLFAQRKPQKAIALLEMAVQVARSTLAQDGWSEDDIVSEVDPILAQKAMILQSIGRTQDAHAIYSKLVAKGSSLDKATRTIVDHNLAVLSISKRSGVDIIRAKQAIQIPGQSAMSLSRFQRALMMYNMANVQLMQGQYMMARRTLNRLSKLYPEIAIPTAGLLSATISLRVGKSKHALEELAAMAYSQKAVSGLRSALAATQIAIALGDTSRALDILSTWRDKARCVSLDNLAEPAKFVKHLFGVCLLIDWLASSISQPNNENSAREAAQHLFKNVSGTGSTDVDVVAAIGDCLACIGENEKARECFEVAQKAAKDPAQVGSVHMSRVMSDTGDSDMKSIQQLLAGYKGYKKAQLVIPGMTVRAARQFQPRNKATLANSTDNKRSGTVTSAKQAEVSSKMTSDRKKAKNISRRRKRLAKSPPKSYDPNHKPDAERWVPLRQRSYYKPRGRGRGRRQQKLRGGTQGGSTEAGIGLGPTGSGRIGTKADATKLVVEDNNNTIPEAAAVSPAANAKGGKLGKGKNRGKGKSGGKGKGGKGKKGSW